MLCQWNSKGEGQNQNATDIELSKVTTKKGSAVFSPTEGPRRRSEFVEMVDKCLSATSPVRFLKPREKAREAEREKMGLISKAREQDIQKLKKKGKDFDSPMIIGTPSMDLITLGAVDADKISKYELIVEDGRRLAKEYTRILMRKHRVRQAVESTLLRLKKEVIEALLENLKAAALVPNLTPFPVNRFMATLTPPIEGYIEKINEVAQKSSGKEKLR